MVEPAKPTCIEDEWPLVTEKRRKSKAAPIQQGLAMCVEKKVEKEAEKEAERKRRTRNWK